MVLGRFEAALAEFEKAGTLAAEQGAAEAAHPILQRDFAQIVEFVRKKEGEAAAEKMREAVRDLRLRIEKARVRAEKRRRESMRAKKVRESERKDPVVNPEKDRFLNMSFD